MEILLEEDFFNCICEAIAGDIYFDTGASYYDLFERMHTTQYEWVVPADSHRAMDGQYLRIRYLTQTGVEKKDWPSSWMSDPCTLLEMFVSFVAILADETDDSEDTWFWILMNTLGLSDMEDGAFDEDEYLRIVNRFMHGEYDYDGGNGGLFKLVNPDQDQRDVELYRQFCAWRLEMALYEGF